MSKALLILEPSQQNLRGIVVSSLKRTGISLVFASALGEVFDFGWLTDFGPLIPISYKCDVLGEQIARGIERLGVELGGVLAYNEFAIPYAIELQKYFGLPRISLRCGHDLRNKYTVRQILLQSGIATQPNYVRVASLIEAEERCASGSIRFPSVVKPTEFSGSLATRIVNNASELLAFLPHVLQADFDDEHLRDHYPTLERAAIIESYVDGKQFSVETVVSNGVPQILGITSKEVAIVDGSFVGTVYEFPFCGLSTEDNERIEKLIQRSHVALKFDFTFTNTDLRLTPYGPIILEINSRIGGDILPRLFQLSSGDSILHLLPKVASGTVFDLRDLPKKLVRAKAAHFHTVRSGRVVSVPASDNGRTVRSTVAKGDLVVCNNLKPAFRLGYELNPPVICSGLLPEGEFEIRDAIDVVTLESGHTLMTFVSQKTDIEEMCKVEQLAWSALHAASEDTIRVRVCNDPLATVVAIDGINGTMIGFFTGVRMPFLNVSQIHPWEFYANLAKDTEFVESSKDRAAFVGGVSLTVLADAPRGTGTALMRSVRKHYKRLGVKMLLTVGRPVGYAKAWAEGVAFSEYYQELLLGIRRDPTYGVFAKAGGIPVGYVESFFADPDSRDYGVAFIHCLMDGITQ